MGCGSVSEFLAVESDDHLPILLMRSVLHQIDALPSPEQQLALADGDVQRYAG